MPKKLPTVSASMIVKNEADRIAKTLTALQPMVDEIIVFDTGSTDGTQVILQEFAAAHPGVVRLPVAPPPIYVSAEEADDGVSRIDFSAARNISREACTMDWILIIDADETLHPCPTHSLQELCAIAEADGVDEGTVSMQHGDGMYPHLRFHRNTSAFYWEHPVHNMLRGGLLRADFPLMLTSPRRDASGPRSIPPLLKFTREHPDHNHGWFYLMQAHFALNDCDKAIEAAERCLTATEGDADVLALVWTTYSLLLWKQGRESESVKACYQGLAEFPNHPALHRLRVTYALKQWYDASAHTIAHPEEGYIHQGEHYLITPTQLAKMVHEGGIEDLLVVSGVDIPKPRRDAHQAEIKRHVINHSASSTKKRLQKKKKRKKAKASRRR